MEVPGYADRITGDRTSLNHHITRSISTPSNETTRILGPTMDSDPLAAKKLNTFSEFNLNSRRATHTELPGHLNETLQKCFTST
jgi:hypothetical protein